MSGMEDRIFSNIFYYAFELYLVKNLKSGLEHGLSSRAPAQAQNPKFKPQYLQNKKLEGEEG
jgi:hypothetical protein